MDIEKLKQKILDLAIRGKLVPQDPNDEPASVLIEKIRKEKEELIKQGKIKRDKNESYIYKGSDNCYYEKIGNEVKNITEELPFEIPNNWSWVRLNELGQFRKGPFGSSLTKEMFVVENTPNRIKVYEQKNAIQKNNKLGKYYISYEKFLAMESFKVEPEDIIVSCAGTIGEIYILPTDSELGIINQALMRIKLYYKNITNYFLMYFDFVLKKEANEKGNGTGMKNIPPFDILKKMLVPLPSINEMNKIISKLKILLSKCDDISLETNALNNTINQIKQKILDYYFGENSCYKSYYENKLTLGDVLYYEQPWKYTVESTNYDNSYNTPVLTPGKTFILGYTNETTGIYDVGKSKVIIFDDFTTASRLVDFNFKVKSSAMKILTSVNLDKFNIEYIFYLLKTINVISNTHKRYWISEYMPICVNIHTINEQKKIVNKINTMFTILNSMSNSI